MRAVVASDTVETRDQLRQLITGLGCDCAAEDCVPLDQLEFRLSKDSIDLIFVDVGARSSEGLRLVSLAAEKALPVIAVGPVDDASRIIETLRRGAREYLDQSKLRDDLLPALTKLQDAGSVRFKQGRSIAVTGVHPGCGVTTIATGLSFVLAKLYPEKVVLAELGPGVPELALHLDMEPRHSFDQLLHEWEYLDRRIVQEAALEHEGGVRVLARAANSLDTIAPDRKGFQQLILLLKSMYEFSVLDLGHYVGDESVEALKLADWVVVVVGLTVPSLRLSRKYVRLLTEKGVSEKRILVVANRAGQKRQISRKEAQESLGQSIKTWIPDDTRTVNSALNTGQPLTAVARRAAIVKRLNLLAKELNGRK